MAWVLPCVDCMVINALYQALAYFPNHKYLLWASRHSDGHSCREHLPDLFLDAWGTNEVNWITQFADTLPIISLGAAAMVCLSTKDSKLWGRLCHLQGFMLLLNGIAENSTTIPSSYGYDRCLDYMGISGPEEDKWSINLTGSCAAMLWSGHTFHFMLGVFVVLWGLQKHFHFHSLTQPAFGCEYSPQKLDFIVMFAGIFIALPLILNHGHYTVDIFLALLISQLAFTNDRLLNFIDGWTDLSARGFRGRATASRNSSIVLEQGDLELESKT